MDSMVAAPQGSPFTIPGNSRVDVKTSPQCTSGDLVIEVNDRTIVPEIGENEFFNLGWFEKGSTFTITSSLTTVEFYTVNAIGHRRLIAEGV